MKKNNSFPWRELLWGIVAIETSALLLMLAIGQQQLLQRTTHLEQALNEGLIPQLGLIQKRTIGITQSEQPISFDQILNSAWDIYRNNAQGFQVYYPAVGYTIKTCGTDPYCTKQPSEKNTTVVLFQSEEFAKTHRARTGLVMDLDIYINDPNDSYLQNGETDAKGNPIRPTLYNSENVTINGLPVLKRDYVHYVYDGTPMKISMFSSTWRFKKGETYYTLFFNNGIPIDKKGAMIFEKFLNSFKFVQ